MDDRVRNNLSYDMLSSGQKLRVNFSIMFSFIKFSENRHDLKFNFLLLDEALSSSADAATKESFLNIIKYKLNKKIVLISHDSSIQNEFDIAFKVEKSGSFSKIRRQ